MKYFTIVLLLLCLGNSDVAMSQQVPSFFLKVPNGRMTGNGQLDYYLDYWADRSIWQQVPRCNVSAMSIFRFVLTKKATIDSVLVSGNLPPVLVDYYVKRIKESAPGWKPAIQNGKPVDSKMILPVFYETYVLEDCPSNPTGKYQPSVRGTAYLLTDFFKSGQMIIPTNGGYMIRPVITETMQ